ncbi:MAG: cyanophycin synthetase [Pseudomonadota bacterium]
MNAPTAVLEHGSTPIAIERFSDVLGVDRNCAQPSVAAMLVVPNVRAIAAGKSRITALLDSLRGGKSPVTAKGEPDIAQTICDSTCDLLRNAGIPVFSKPHCNPIDSYRYHIRIPTVTGAHAQTRTLVTGLVSLANAGLTGSPTEELQLKIQLLLKQMRTLAPTGRNTMPLLATAHARDIPWERVTGNVYRLGQGACSRWFDSSITDRTPAIGVGLAKNKQATASVLRHQLLPVPRHILVSSEVEALAAAKKIGFPVVVKPANLDRGIGVASGLRDDRTVSKAFHAAFAHSRAILVEKHFEGRDYRVHVFEGEVYKVRHRIPGGVTGDGVSTIEHLLALLNADPARGVRGSNANKVIIDLDEEALDLLVQQGLEPSSVPQAGRIVQLRRIANVSVGGVSHPVSMDQVHPDNVALAIRAVGALKLDLAAVDLLIPDISRSWLEVGAAICEVNAQPQFGPDAPEWIFGKIFPGNGRIPIAVVIGEGPQEEWADKLRRLVKGAGKRLGFCSPLGLWVDDQLILTTESLDVFNGANLLLGNQAVDSLLLFADESLMRYGLPSTQFDALALTGKTLSAKASQLVNLLAQHSKQVFAATQLDAAVLAECRLRCDDCSTHDLDDLSDRLVKLLCGSRSGAAI